MKQTVVLSIAAALIAVYCITLFAADENSADKPIPTERRIYDVSDLLHESQVDAENTSIVPPTEIGGTSIRSSGRGSNSGIRGNSSAQERSGVDLIVKLIQDSIDQSSWRDAGGSLGSINTLNNRLIITTSAANHSSIDQLLAELRRTDSPTVRVQVLWASLSDEQVQSILASASDRNSQPQVDLAALEKIKGAVRCRSQIATLSGTRVNITAGRARSALTGLAGVVGTSAATFEPTIDLVLSGAVLQVKPTVSPDGSTATLDLRATLSRWDASDLPPMKVPQPVAATQASTKPAGPPFDVERLNMPVHLLATMVKIPTSRPVLIGGMTMDDERAKDANPVYLIVEVTAAR